MDARKNKQEKWEKRGKSFIIPLCKKHNNPKQTNPFFIDKNCELINDQFRDKCEQSTYILNKNSYFFMKVIRSPKKTKCGCDDFWSHYKRITGSKRTRCTAMECGADAVAAGQKVALDKRRDFDKWIAPMCKTHLKPGSEVSYVQNTPKTGFRSLHQEACVSGFAEKEQQALRLRKQCRHLKSQIECFEARYH